MDGVYPRFPSPPIGRGVYPIPEPGGRKAIPYGDIDFNFAINTNSTPQHSHHHSN